MNSRPLPPHDVAGALLAAGEQAADHDGARARAHRGCDVARAANASVGDQRHACLARRAGAVEHRRQLRHADARDEPGRAREAGADPDLDRVRAGGGEVGDAVPGRDVPGHDLDVGPGALQLLHRLDRGIGVTVGDVEHERVDLCGDQRLGANEVVAADPDRGSDAQPAEAVARRARVAVGEREIAERDEPRDPVVAVDERELLDPVRGEEAARVLELDPGLARDEPLARRHQLVDALVVLAREHVARRQQPEQALLRADDDEPGHLQPAAPRPARAPTVRSGSITYGSPTTCVR